MNRRLYTRLFTTFVVAAALGFLATPSIGQNTGHGRAAISLDAKNCWVSGTYYWRGNEVTEVYAWIWDETAQDQPAYSSQQFPGDNGSIPMDTAGVAGHQYIVQGHVSQAGSDLWAESRTATLRCR